MAVDVSIIIVNYNTPQLTESCVRSVLGYTQGCSYEILLVDNASTVGDISFLAGIDERVKYLPQPYNWGFAKGNNMGWYHAQGEYILLLNSDTELISDAVSLSLAQLKVNPEVGALSVALAYPNGNPQYPTGAFASLKTEFLALTRVDKFLSESTKQKLHYGSRMDVSKACKPDWIWGAYFMCPRTVIERMPNGKLAEDFFMYHEDVLWCWIIKKKLLLDILYSPVATVIHHLSGSEKNSQTEELKYRKRIFPNELAFSKTYRGNLYTWGYYMIRILHYVSLRTPQDREKARWYLKQVFGL